MAQVVSASGLDAPPNFLDLSIRPFDSDMNRTAFSCSNKDLTDYFRNTGSNPRTLTHDSEKGVAKAHVLIHKETNEIFGFFTLSQHAIPRTHLPNSKSKQGQTTDVSTTLLGRMAISSKLEGKGFGGRLLLAACAKACELSQLVGSTAIVLDPKNEELVKFYEHHKFTLIKNPDKPLRMYLPMGTARELLKEKGQS